jgi:ElaB/YqjD/DUF883 family membrane-anchored ribosome-binding protein
MSSESIPFPTSSTETRPPAGPDFSAGAAGRDAASSYSDGAAFADGTHESAAHANALIERIARSAHHTIDRLAESAAPHVNRLQEGLTGAGDTLHQRADQMREVGDEWAESLRCTVRENPLAAVGVALVVGVLIARSSR